MFTRPNPLFDLLRAKEVYSITSLFWRLDVGKLEEKP